MSFGDNEDWTFKTETVFTITSGQDKATVETTVNDDGVPIRTIILLGPTGDVEVTVTCTFEESTFTDAKTFAVVAFSKLQLTATLSGDCNGKATTASDGAEDLVLNKLEGTSVWQQLQLTSKMKLSDGHAINLSNKSGMTFATTGSPCDNISVDSRTVTVSGDPSGEGVSLSCLLEGTFTHTTGSVKTHALSVRSGTETNAASITINGKHTQSLLGVKEVKTTSLEVDATFKDGAECDDMHLKSGFLTYQ